MGDGVDGQASESGRSLFSLGVGLAAVDALDGEMGSVLGGAGFEEEDFEDLPSADEGTPVKGKHGKTRGKQPEKGNGLGIKSKAKEKAKAKAKGKAKKLKFCWNCQQETDDWGTKSECRPCNNDKEAAERDAKAQGEHEYFKSMSKDKDLMRKFLARWVQDPWENRFCQVPNFVFLMRRGL